MSKPKTVPAVKKAEKTERKPHLVSTQLSTEAYEKLVERARTEDRKVGYLVRRAVLDLLGMDSKAA